MTHSGNDHGVGNGHSKDDTGAHLRVNDAQRQEVANQLGLALSEGYLTLDEFDQRIRDVWQAPVMTRGELDKILVDIPIGPSGVPVPLNVGATDPDAVPAWLTATSGPSRILTAMVRTPDDDAAIARGGWQARLGAAKKVKKLTTAVRLFFGVLIVFKVAIGGPPMLLLLVAVLMSGEVLRTLAGLTDEDTRALMGYEKVDSITRGEIDAKLARGGHWAGQAWMELLDHGVSEEERRKQEQMRNQVLRMREQRGQSGYGHGGHGQQGGHGSTGWSYRGGSF